MEEIWESVEEHPFESWQEFCLIWFWLMDLNIISLSLLNLPYVQLKILLYYIVNILGN